MPSCGASGFTLLEVLVAFVITILAVSLVISGTAGALLGAHTAVRYQEATVRAQSRLEAAANAGIPIPGEREGDDGGGFHWRERVSILRTEAARTRDQPLEPLALYAVTVWVSWREGRAARAVQLDTQRVAALAKAS